ncbi:ATP-grasp domain-containing protein [Pseudalkalibacillus caeni]|uniref:ATP-grasp domain-containing protein n=1 Tax=Exobacillus caeni TaxID=2574798 RepID=A0A5R9F9X4_9BACL|nr:hypothetical protein [Pseudalkalibacillus caeni]TLS37653.1 hypothetical protein FCL54_07445 [Pseudalkalibacillus caeni]
MKLVTFNPFRTIGIPGVQYVKPDNMFKDIDKIREADFLLFPEKWMVNSLVYGLHKEVFPSIQTIQLGFDKVEMTRALWSVASDHVPQTEIAGKSRESIQKILELFPFPFVAKEIRNSMGNGVFLIKSKEEFIAYAERNDVLYIQEYLPIDRDLRICYVGDSVLSAYWRIGEDNFHNNVARGGKIAFHNIPQEALKLVEDTASLLGINHAGFDVVFANDRFYFLEFNSLFGNQALIQQKLSVEKVIYEYLLRQHTPKFPTTPVFGGSKIS